MTTCLFTIPFMVYTTLKFLIRTMCFIIRLPLALLFFAVGLAMSCTLVLLPFGLQFLKLSKLAFGPHRCSVVTVREDHPFLNFLWDITFGLILAIPFLVLSIVCFVTLIGIPFGKMFYKMFKVALSPLGAYVERDW